MVSLNEELAKRLLCYLDQYRVDVEENCALGKFYSPEFNQAVQNDYDCLLCELEGQLGDDVIDGLLEDQNYLDNIR